MIKQFNFYDIYGYLMPGLLLVFLAWLPLGIITQSWPTSDQTDLSKGVFFLMLGYVLGHFLRTIGTSVVPSTVNDKKGCPRNPSDLLLDKTNSKFPDALKTYIAQRVDDLFHLKLQIDQDGKGGKDAVSKTRNAAFFQARAFLIANKEAQYTEQFEGLYGMMRSYGCAFFAAAFYLSGWEFYIRHQGFELNPTMTYLSVVAGIGALLSTLAPMFHSLIAPTVARLCNRLGAPLDADPMKEEKGTDRQDLQTGKPKSIWRNPDLWLAFSLLLAALAAGYWSAVWQPASIWHNAPNNAMLLIVACIAASLVAAAKCFSAYRTFADRFAETVWSDFAAHLKAASQPGSTLQADDDESQEL